jgi:hypothetical protein
MTAKLGEYCVNLRYLRETKGEGKVNSGSKQ